jgi:F0F1-type ATP synthase assembly protein I
VTDNQKKENKEQKSPKPWLALSGAGMQMAVIIFGCAYAGNKLDEHYLTTKPWVTLTLVLLGIFTSLYLLMKQIKNLND